MAMIRFSPRRTLLLTFLLALVAGASAGIVATVMLDATLEEYAAALFAGRVPGTPGTKPRQTTTLYDESLETVRTIGESSVAVITTTTLDSRLSASWIDAHEALGYGVVVSADGWILLHTATVDGMANPLRSSEVWVSGERYVPTQFVRDTLTSTALMKIDASGLTPVAFAASEVVVPGEQVFAPSTPSAVRAMTVVDTRYVDELAVMPAETLVYDWQLSEASRRALPVFDGDGSLLALQANGVASPIHAVTAFVKEVIRDGAPTHAGLGAYVVDLESALNIDDALRGGETHGALVIAPPSGAAAVVRSSPAGVAGILAGDILTAVDGVRVDHRTTLAELLRLYDPGETAAFTVVRNGAEQAITVTFADYADLLY